MLIFALKIPITDLENREFHEENENNAEYQSQNSQILHNNASQEEYYIENHDQNEENNYEPNENEIQEGEQYENHDENHEDGEIQDIDENQCLNNPEEQEELEEVNQIDVEDQMDNHRGNQKENDNNDNINNNQEKYNPEQLNEEELKESMGIDEEIKKNNNNNPDDEPIYTMTIELEQGKTELINIYSNSEAVSLAYDFCKTNNLDSNAFNYLSEEIQNLIVKFVSKSSTNILNGTIRESIAELDEEEVGSEIRKNSNTIYEVPGEIKEHQDEHLISSENEDIDPPNAEQLSETGRDSPKGKANRDNNNKNLNEVSTKNRNQPMNSVNTLRSYQPNNENESESQNAKDILYDNYNYRDGDNYEPQEVNDRQSQSQNQNDNINSDSENRESRNENNENYEENEVDDGIRVKHDNVDEIDEENNNVEDENEENNENNENEYYNENEDQENIKNYYEENPNSDSNLRDSNKIPNSNEAKKNQEFQEHITNQVQFDNKQKFKNYSFRNEYNNIQFNNNINNNDSKIVGNNINIINFFTKTPIEMKVINLSIAKTKNFLKKFLTLKLTITTRITIT